MEASKKKRGMIKKAERISKTALFVEGEIPIMLEGNLKAGRYIKSILMELRKEIKSLQQDVKIKITELREGIEEEEEEPKKKKTPKAKKAKEEKKSKKKKKDKETKTKPKKKKKKKEINPDLLYLATKAELDISDCECDEDIISALHEEFASWKMPEVNAETKKFQRIFDEYGFKCKDSKPKKKKKSKKDEEEKKPKKKKVKPEPKDEEEEDEEEEEEVEDEEDGDGEEEEESEEEGEGEYEEEEEFEEDDDDESGDDF